VKQGEYAGTFKWSQKTDFVPLPPFEAPAPLESWQSYLQVRMDTWASSSSAQAAGGKQGEPTLVVEPSMLDGLSFPLSLLYALRQLLSIDKDFKDRWQAGSKELAILALGCSERAEEHVLRHTNYFGELSHYLPRFSTRLWMVGPEMSARGHMQDLQLAPNLSATCYRGTTAAFLAEEQQALQGRQVLAILYNTGCTTGDAALRASWSSDLRELLGRGWPCVFTCANDHSDLKGERALMEGELRARYVVYPRKNPFAAVTTLHPPGQRDTGWYAANSFLYVVAGTQGGAQQQRQPNQPDQPQQQPSKGTSSSKPQASSSQAQRAPQGAGLHQEPAIPSSAAVPGAPSSHEMEAAGSQLDPGAGQLPALASLQLLHVGEQHAGEQQIDDDDLYMPD